MISVKKPAAPQEPTRDRILATASAQILQKGIQNTSLAEVAKSIKISKGTLYYHFRSKDSLIEEIARKNFEETAIRIKEDLEKIAPKKGKDILSIAINALTVERKNAKILHFIYLEILQGNKKLGFKILKIYQQMKQTIAEAILPFCKTREEAEKITATVLAISDGANLGNMLGMNELDPVEAVKYLKV